MKNKNCQECDDCGGNAAQVMPPQNENNCPQPNLCTSITNSGCVFHLGEDINCGEGLVIENGDSQEVINAKIVEFLCETLRTFKMHN